jgi:hypothetical protein
MNPAATAAPDEFQPGQLGVRHLLGFMSVAAVIFGVSAARLRTMQPLERVVIGWNWFVILALLAVTFSVTSRRQRQKRQAAGKLLLQAYARPNSEGSRTIAKWTLTALVILDGILMSVGLYPHAFIPKSSGPWSRLDMFLFAMNFTSMTALARGTIWSWCLTHWLKNIHLMELRENGLLTHFAYHPWSQMKRLSWSTIFPSKLMFFCGGNQGSFFIDPASREDVEAVLKSLRERHPGLEP